MKHKKRFLITIIALALFTLAIAILSACSKCPHEWEEWTIVKRATCTESGKQERTCPLCKETEAKTIEPSHDFDTESWGYKVASGHAHICLRCGEADAMTSHISSGEAREGVASTCLACNYIIAPALDHTEHFAEDEWAYDTINHWHECKGCEDMEFDLDTHKLESVKYNEGSHWYECECGYKTKATEHIWDKGTVTKEPTISTKGEKTYSCSVCESTYTEELDVLAHEHNLLRVEKIEAECEKAGIFEHWACQICEEVFLDASGKTRPSDYTELIIPPTNHKNEELIKRDDKLFYICPDCKREVEVSFSREEN